MNLTWWRVIRDLIIVIVDWILDEAGVALLPGFAFGKFGEGYLRLSCANSIENIQKALERLGEIL